MWNVRWGLEPLNSKDSKWKPLWKRDSDKLEQIAINHGNNVNAKVCIRNTHRMAHIRERIVTENYSESSTQWKLVRGSWFRSANSRGLPMGGEKGKLIAFSEEIASGIENWYMKVKDEFLKECAMLPESQDIDEEDPADWSFDVGEALGSGQGCYRITAVRRRLVSMAALRKYAIRRWVLSRSAGEDVPNTAVESSYVNYQHKLAMELIASPSDADLNALATDSSSSKSASPVYTGKPDIATAKNEGNWLKNLFKKEVKDEVEVALPEKLLTDENIDEEIHQALSFSLVKVVDFLGQINLSSYEVRRGYPSSVQSQVPSTGEPVSASVFECESDDEVWWTQCERGLFSNNKCPIASGSASTGSDAMMFINDDNNIPTGHLVFVVHGVGETLWSSPTGGSDGTNSHQFLKSFRSTVVTFSEMCQEWNISRYCGDKEFCTVPTYSLEENHGRYRRVDFIPIEWHECIHNKDLDLTLRLKSITNANVPLIRAFGNAVTVDLLTYQTEEYHYRVLHDVTEKMNSMYSKYCEYNPQFSGNVSLIGHSLGSVITFDILSAQSSGGCNTVDQSMYDASSNNMDNKGFPKPDLSLMFEPKNLFIMGSPLGLFHCIRTNGSLIHDPCKFKLPTCPRLFNIFHPFDAISFRIEPLLLPEFEKIPPVIMDHHSGMLLHYKLKHISNEVNRGFTKIKDSLQSIFRPQPKKSKRKSKEPPKEEDSSMFSRVLASMLTKSADSESDRSRSSSGSFDSNMPNSALSVDDTLVVRIEEIPLNSGDRIDYVLQESMLESYQEYLAAVVSHSSYFDNKDVAMFVVQKLRFD